MCVTIQALFRTTIKIFCCAVETPPLICPEKGVSRPWWYVAHYKHVRAFLEVNKLFKHHVFITVQEAKLSRSEMTVLTNAYCYKRSHDMVIILCFRCGALWHYNSCHGNTFKGDILFLLWRFVEIMHWDKRLLTNSTACYVHVLLYNAEKHMFTC
jgi:hypothetical protein